MAAEAVYRRNASNAPLAAGCQQKQAGTECVSSCGSACMGADACAEPRVQHCECVVTTGAPSSCEAEFEFACATAHSLQVLGSRGVAEDLITSALANSAVTSCQCFCCLLCLARCARAAAFHGF